MCVRVCVCACVCVCVGGGGGQEEEEEVEEGLAMGTANRFLWSTPAVFVLLRKRLVVVVTCGK